MKEAIAAIGLTNVASINIYEVDDESILAGINNYKPRRYKLYYTGKGCYFNFIGARYYLSQAMRV